MSKTVLLLPGDGIGPEVVAAGARVLEALVGRHEIEITLEQGLIGGAALDRSQRPLPAETFARAKRAQAILLGAVGGPAWDRVDASLRPEKGLLELRAGLGLFANLRPATLHPELSGVSPLRPEVVEGLDILIVRELCGDVYYGEPRGIRVLEGGERQGYNTLVYREGEIRRIARVAFDVARRRRCRVCSIDKANVLEATRLWREVVQAVGQDFPDVELTHMYVDNAAMQLVRQPTAFDVMLTPNMFGDILSDLAAAVTGSIGMLPSASLNQGACGLYEPIHGSAPDIAGRDLANPLATILSVAMMLRHSLGAQALAERVEQAVTRVLQRGLRTRDIYAPGTTEVGTRAMAEAVLREL
ncbi:MAG: 3-isopropylmalate dehydrogenase [Gammaproteobacteria bacterium]